MPPKPAKYLCVFRYPCQPQYQYQYQQRDDAQRVRRHETTVLENEKAGQASQDGGDDVGFPQSIA